MAAVARKTANQYRLKTLWLTLLVLGIGILAEVAIPRATALRLSSASKEGKLSRGSISGADLRKGRRLFLRDCAHCHGRSGDGNSPVRQTLHPTPFDLTAFNLTDSFILNVLHEGVPGSDMPAWHVSPEDDLRAVSAYTSSLGRPDQLLENDRFAAPEALQEAGRRIYTIHCARCHGEHGNGDGKDATRYSPTPPSFRGLRPSYAAAKRIIEKGVPGTAMASWPLLTQPEIQAVTYYIRSLYAERETESSRTTGATR
jgi:mono/diheme cytochrome c family protein